MIRSWRASGSAGAGSLAGGFGVFWIVAGFGGGVGWQERVTFDQAGHLELEGIALFYGIVLGTVLGTLLGSYLVLKLMRYPSAGTTAGLTCALAIATTLALGRLIPAGARDPVVLPYAVYAAWFLSGAAAVPLRAALRRVR